MDDVDATGMNTYDADTTELILAEAAEVLRAAGFTSSHMVIIGGLVPSLLVPILDPGMPPHIGTTDIDICLSVALVEGETEQYERLEAVLRSLEYAPDESTFRWIRASPPRVTLEFFCPAAPGRPAGTMHRPKASENPRAKHNLGGRLSALSLDAGALLVEDVEIVTRKVDLPRGKGVIELPLRVTGPLAFLAAKADALQQRDKPKDAYDIIWLLESWPGGPAAAALDFAKRAAYSSPVRQQLTRLATLFADTDAVGARSYATFAAEPRDRLLAARRAVGAVKEFIDALPGEQVGNLADASLDS